MEYKRFEISSGKIPEWPRPVIIIMKNMTSLILIENRRINELKDINEEISIIILGRTLLAIALTVTLPIITPIQYNDIKKPYSNLTSLTEGSISWGYSVKGKGRALLFRVR